MVIERWNRWFGCETIHHTLKFTLINLLQTSCVITWKWSFLTSEVVEAFRGQKHYISMHTLAQRLTQHSVHPTAPVLLSKDSRNEIIFDFQSPFCLHILNSRTKLAGLDFCSTYPSSIYSWFLKPLSVLHSLFPTKTTI